MSQEEILQLQDLLGKARKILNTDWVKVGEKRGVVYLYGQSHEIYEGYLEWCKATLDLDTGEWDIQKDSGCIP